MMLVKSEKQAIKSLMEDRRFDVVLKLYESLIDKWSREPGVGMNEFDTLRLTFTKEGKILGLKGFFEILENQGQEGAEEI